MITRSPGANPTIASYNASAVKIYNATNTLVRFKNKKYYLLQRKKRSSLLQRWRCRCKLRSRMIGSRYVQITFLIFVPTYLQGHNEIED
jgi:hypothetical protein